MRRHRICFLLANYFEQVRGGAEYQAYLLARELKSQGFEVHYICIDNGRAFEPELEIGLEFVRRRWLVRQFGGKFAFLADAPAILSKLRRINPDIIYQRTGTAHTAIAAYYARRYYKCFVWHIASENDVLPCKFTLRNVCRGQLVDAAALRWGIKYADVILAQAQYQDVLLQRHHSRGSTALVPNVVPISGAPKEKPRDILNVGWVGSLRENKQPQAFLELARACEQDPRFVFNMAGRATSDFGKKMAREAGASPNVHYLGELTEAHVAELLDRCHVLVNTSIKEGFPNTFIQAWSRGAPVLSLNANPDGVLEREGLGFCVGSVQRLGDYCRLLATDERLLRKLGRNGYEYVRRVHSVKDNVAQMLAAIEKRTAASPDQGTKRSFRS